MDRDDSEERRMEHTPPADFTQLAAAFESLRQLAPAAREAALAALASDHPDIATGLRRLFRHHDGDPDRLAAPDRAFDARSIATAMDEAMLPASIGPWRPLRELGRGGMGTVYLAERPDADFHRVVAVKVLRAAIDDADQQRRFRTERRILATLVHPNIAAMYDGGTTETGQPYVVMEHVDGNDLLTHCDQRRIDLTGRLHIFVKVCRATAHAHRALVVHRDLKPGNILVTADGEPKLLDFGIAKLLHDADSADGRIDTIAVTRTGNLLLTPEYCSPEQVRGEAVTTATDVYALGTILYELLSGHRAQPLENRSLASMMAMVCDRSPPPPSTCPTTGLSRRQLRGDLDTIVACAMRKEPERRYGSAAALADDLERHLAGLPVAAQPDTLSYRARKFVSRHRVPMAAAVLLAVALAGFTVVTALQNRTISRERDAAVTQRVVADEIADFLVDLFAMASPDPERAETLRARELLDRGARRIDTEMVAFPARQAPLQLAMGRAYLQMGLYTEARPLLEAVERTFAERAADDNDRRTAQYWLGLLDLHQGRPASGEQRLRESLADTGIPATAVAQRHCTLASWLAEAGRFDEAEELLDAAERATSGSSPTIAASGGDLAVARAAILRDRGRSDRSLAILQATCQLVEQNGDADHPRHYGLYRELGLVHQELGNLEEARAALERALRIARTFAGESHPDVDAALFAVAMLEHDLGDLPRAETLLRELMARDLQRFGEKHPYPALVRGQLAMVVGALDRADEAEALFLDALRLQRELLPADHPELPTTIANLGTFYNRMRRYDDAAPLFTEALALRERIFAADHPAVLTTRNQIAVLELERGNTAEAEREFRAVLAARQRTLGEHADTAGSLLSLATAIARQGRHTEAVPLFEQSIAMLGTTLPELHPTQARPRVGLALARMRLGEPDVAEPLLRRAIVINAAGLGTTHHETSHVEWLLARCLLQRRQTAAATTLLRTLQARLLATHPGDRLLQEVQRTLADAESR